MKWNRTIWSNTCLFITECLFSIVKADTILCHMFYTFTLGCTSLCDNIFIFATAWQKLGFDSSHLMFFLSFAYNCHIHFITCSSFYFYHLFEFGHCAVVIICQAFICQLLIDVLSKQRFIFNSISLEQLYYFSV